MNNSLKYIYLLSILLIVLLNGYSQQITFNKVYNYISLNANSIAFSVQQTADSGYVIAGKVSITNGNPWNQEVLIIKVNKYGDTLWTKTSGGSLADIAYDIERTSDGGYIVAGIKDCIVNTINFSIIGNMWILKLNQNGDTLWTRTYGGPYNDYANSIKQTADGGYIVAGTKNNTGINSHGDIWVLKLNQNGDTIWTKTFHFSNYLSEANTIFETNQGNYFLVGSSAIGSSSIAKILVLKLQNNGDSIWCKKLNGYIGNDVIQIEDSNLIVAGRGNPGGLIYKLNASGDIIWTRNCPPDQGYYFQINSLTTDTSGNIIAMGEKSNTYDQIDLWLHKLSTNGDSLWTKFYDFSMKDQGMNIKNTNDGGLIVAGRSDDYAWLFKLDENGNLTTNNILDNNNFNVWNYPNPFSNSTTIYYQIPSCNNKMVEITILNSMGNIIKTINSNSNENYVLFDSNDLPSGIYFYKISTENTSICKKMILIK
ncbi:MAG: T9SS type A sorting domain-containing protein [Bacteroidia bacterium]|nr:T9SS type A sorting domain-containing protein [Bacteroidia bacterium]